jgi:hypothetical protein
VLCTQLLTARLVNCASATITQIFVMQSTRTASCKDYLLAAFDSRNWTPLVTEGHCEPLAAVESPVH